MNIHEIVEKFLYTFEDMNQAINAAGGSGFSIEETREITLFHFLCDVCATNGIRFLFEKDKVER